MSQKYPLILLILIVSFPNFSQQQSSSIELNNHTHLHYEYTINPEFTGTIQNLRYTGTLFILADSTNDGIKIFDETGSEYSAFGIQNPFGLTLNETHLVFATSSSDTVYVATYGTTPIDPINVVDSTTISSSQFKGMASNSTHIFVGDAFTSKILVFDRALNHVDTIGNGFGSGDGQFNIPYNLDVNSTHIVVTDYTSNRFQIFDLAGNFIQAVQSNGSYAVTFFQDLIASTDFASHEIHLYRANGDYLSSIGNNSIISSPRSIETNETHLFVAEGGTPGKISIFSSSYKPLQDTNNFTVTETEVVTSYVTETVTLNNTLTQTEISDYTTTVTSFNTDQIYTSTTITEITSTVTQLPVKFSSLWSIFVIVVMIWKRKQNEII